MFELIDDARQSEVTAGGTSTIIRSDYPTDPMAILAEIDALLDRLPADVGAAFPDPLGSGALGRALKLADRHKAIAAQLSAQANTDGLFALDGSGSCAAHMARNYPISPAQARTLCAVGASLRDDLVATATSLRDGSLGWDAGLDMVKLTTTSERRRQALDELVPMNGRIGRATKACAATEDRRPGTDINIGPAADTRPGTGARIDTDTAAGTGTGTGTSLDTDSNTKTGGADTAPTDSGDGPPMIRCEEWLVAMGKTMPQRQFRRFLRYWAAVVDPDTDERGYGNTEADEYLVVAETMDAYHIQGKLTIEHGQLLHTALRHIIGVPKSGDERSPLQRNAHALTSLAQIVLEQNLDSKIAAARPHISLVLSWETFKAMAGAAGTPEAQLTAMAGADPATWADGTGPIPPSLLATIACDSDITRVVFGPGNQLINLGRTERVISPGLRSAIIARDRHCGYPRCDAPPVLCQAHHVHRWTDGGKTDAENLALLCWRHHRWIHANGIVMSPSRESESTGTAVPTGAQGILTGTAPAYDFTDRNGNLIE